MDSSRCRAASCERPLTTSASERGPRRFYCKRHWRELEAYLLGEVDLVYPLARTIYIGRSNYPERRLLEHWTQRGRDQLGVLHWTGDWAEMSFLEQWLIRHYKDRRKGVNLDGSSSGRWEGAWNCLYLSWQWKQNAVPPKHLVGEAIRHLDDGSRLTPSRADWPGSSLYLHAAVTPEEGERLLAGLHGLRKRRRPRSK